MYNGARNRQDMAERICQSEGHNPSHTLTDKLYRNRDNLLYCKEEDIHRDAVFQRLTGFATNKGRTRCYLTLTPKIK